MTSLSLLLFLSLYCALLLRRCDSFTTISNARLRTYLAAGFGGGGNTNKAKKKKVGRLMGPTTLKPQATDVKPRDPEPILDKWGLPPPNLESIFPPMPEGTEMVGVDADRKYNLDDIERALQNHVDMQLGRHFDAEGASKTLQKLKLLHTSPPVLEIENFMTPQECHYVRELVMDDGSEDAYQVNSATFQGAVSTRTSTSWFCNYNSRAMLPLLTKAHTLLGVPLPHMEEPQIVRYRAGQEFSWHYDEVPKAQLENGGQRLATLLVYLNDMPEGTGGGTVFRDLTDQLTMRPKLGSALLFFPAFRDGTPDERTLHKGEPVGDGHEKWIVQMWVHESEYTAALPPTGNRQSNANEGVSNLSRELGLIE